MKITSSSSFTSSNSNLNREDSFTNLNDIIMGEKFDTGSTTSQMNNKGFEITRKVEELEFKINQLTEEKIFIKKDFDNLKKINKELVKELQKSKEEKAYFLKVSNNWELTSYSSCCRNNCVNNCFPKNICIYGYGFIQILSKTNIKYNCKPVFNNSEAVIEEVNKFKRPVLSKLCLNCSNYTLYYYEIKLKIERSKPLIEIGLLYYPFHCYFYSNSINGYICYNIVNKTKFINLSSSFSFNNEDIIGCGVVYPPPNINNNKLPYIFFTKNGELIGKAIQVKGRYNLNPFVRLKFCSIETNFGDDLNSKPFKYDVTNHYVIKEFYEDEDFTDK